MSDLLMSLKPKFSDKIYSNKKKWELRRCNIRSLDNSSIVYIYTSSPISKVTGYFISDLKIKVSSDNLINNYIEINRIAKMDKDEFDQYYNGMTGDGVAIKISMFHKYSKPIELSLFTNFEIKYPPQSFQYLSQKLKETLRRLNP